MPVFQVRNQRTKMVLGEVSVSDPERVLDELALSNGCTVEEIARSLGATTEEAKASLDIVALKMAPATVSRCIRRSSLPPRRLFG